MRIINIYTDGSHFKGQLDGRLGCGGVMLDENLKKIDEFSEEISKDWLNENYNTTDVSNPTAEMIGTMLALDKFNFQRGDLIYLHSDYTGVRDWMTGRWKINKPYIKKIKDNIEKIIKQKGITVRFIWIESHQKPTTSLNAFWNDYTDSLAKGEKPKGIAPSNLTINWKKI